MTDEKVIDGSSLFYYIELMIMDIMLLLLITTVHTATLTCYAPGTEISSYYTSYNKICESFSSLTSKTVGAPFIIGYKISVSSATQLFYKMNVPFNGQYMVSVKVKNIADTSWKNSYSPDTLASYGDYTAFTDNSASTILACFTLQSYNTIPLLPASYAISFKTTDTIKLACGPMPAFLTQISSIGLSLTPSSLSFTNMMKYSFDITINITQSSNWPALAAIIPENYVYNYKLCICIMPSFGQLDAEGTDSLSSSNSGDFHEFIFTEYIDDLQCFSYSTEKSPLTKIQLKDVGFKYKPNVVDEDANFSFIKIMEPLMFTTSTLSIKYSNIVTQTPAFSSVSPATFTVQDKSVRLLITYNFTGPIYNTSTYLAGMELILSDNYSFSTNSMLLVDDSNLSCSASGNSMSCMITDIMNHTLFLSSDNQYGNVSILYNVPLFKQATNIIQFAFKCAYTNESRMTSYFTPMLNFTLTANIITISTATTLPAILNVGDNTTITTNIGRSLYLTNGLSFLSIEANNSIAFNEAIPSFEYHSGNLTNIILKYTGDTGDFSLNSIMFNIQPLLYNSSFTHVSYTFYQGDATGNKIGDIAYSTTDHNIINVATITSIEFKRSGKAGDSTNTSKLNINYPATILCSNLNDVSVSISFPSNAIQISNTQPSPRAGYVTYTNYTVTPTSTLIEFFLYDSFNCKDIRTTFSDFNYSISRGDKIIAYGSVVPVVDSISVNLINCNITSNTTIFTGGYYILLLSCNLTNSINGYLKITLSDYPKLGFANSTTYLNGIQGLDPGYNSASFILNDSIKQFTASINITSYSYTANIQTIALNTYINESAVTEYASDAGSITFYSNSPNIISISSISYSSSNLSLENTVDIFFTVFNSLDTADTFTAKIPLLTFKNITSSSCPSTSLNISCTNMVQTCSSDSNFMYINFPLTTCNLASSGKAFKLQANLTNAEKSVDSSTANNCFELNTYYSTNSSLKKDKSNCIPGTTLSAVNFQSISLNQPSAIYTASKFSFDIVITASIEIPSTNGVFKISIPNYILFITSPTSINITCKINNVDITCPVISNTTISDIYATRRYSLTEVNLTINETLADQSIFAISFHDVYSPYGAKSSTSAIGVSSYIFNNPANSDSTYLNPITVLTYASSIAKSLATTDATIDVVVNILTPNILPFPTTMTLYLHKMQFNQSGTLICPVGSTCSVSLVGEYYVIPMNLTSEYNANYNLLLTIKGFTNPHSILDPSINKEWANMDCNFNQSVHYLSSRNMTITPDISPSSPTSVEILLSEKTITKETNVTINVNNSNNLLATDYLYIAFTDPFPSTTSCTQLPTGVSIDTDLNSKLKLKISSSVCASKFCSITFCTQNILSKQNMGAFTYTVTSSSNLIVSTLSCASSSVPSLPCLGFSADYLKALSIPSAAFTRKVQNASTNTNVSLSFNTNFITKAGSKAIITIPSNQITNSTSISGNNSTTSISNSSFVVEINLNLEFTTTTDIKVYTVILSGFKNKDKYYLKQDTATLNILESNNLIATYSDQLYITPPIKIDQFTLVNISKSNSQTGRSLTLSFTTQLHKISATTEYYFVIDFGDSTLYKDSSQIQCDAQCGGSTSTICQKVNETIYSSNAINRVKFNFKAASSNLTCSFVIYGLKNPKFAGALPSSIYYHFALKTSDEEALEQFILFYDDSTLATLLNSIKTEACPLTLIEMKRGSGVLVEATTLTVSIKLCNSLITGNSAKVLIPVNLFALNSGSPCSNCACSLIESGTKSMECLFTIQQNYNEEDNLVFTFNGNNPSSLGGQTDATSFITVSTQLSDNKIIDKIQGKPSELNHVSISISADSKRTTNLAGALSTYSFSFGIPTSLSPYSLTITVPDDLLYDTTEKSCAFLIEGELASSECAYTTTQHLFGEKAISTVQFSGVITNLSTSNNVIQITGLNPFYAYSYPSVYISVVIQDALGGTFAEGNASIAGKVDTTANSLSLKLKSGTVIYAGKETDLTLLVSSQVKLFTVNSQIDIYFPYSIFTDTVTCTSTASAVNLKCEYISDSSKFTITTDTIINASTEISTTINKIKGLDNAQPIKNINATHSLMGQHAAVGTNINIKVEPASLKEATIERGQNLIAGQANNFTISFITNSTLNNNTNYFIEMYIPDSVFKYASPKTSIQLSLSYNGVKSSYNFTFNVNNSRVQITSGNIMFGNATDNIPVIISLENTDNSIYFINPPYVINYEDLPIPYAESSFIYIGKDNYYIEGMSSNITVKPSSIPGSLKINTVERESKILASLTSLKISFSLFSNSIMNTTQVVIEFPSKFLFKKEKLNDLQCSLQTSISDLTCTYKTDEITGELFNITISNICQLAAGCSNATYNITLKNLENPISAYKANGLIKISTYDTFEIGDLQDKRSLLIDTALHNISSLPSLIVKQLSRVVLSPNNPIAGSESNLTISLYLDYPITKGTKVTIIFPSQITMSISKGRQLSDTLKCNVAFPKQFSTECVYNSDSNTITISKSVLEDISGVIIYNIFNIKLSSTKGNSGGFMVSFEDDAANVYAEPLDDKSTIPILEPVSKCSGNCLSCGDSSDYCTSCDFNSDTPLLYNGKCLDSCPQKYIDFGTLCLPCFDSNCLLCTTMIKSGCTACSSSLYISNGMCTSTCPSGTKTTTDGKCQNTGECTSPCETCSYGKTYCFTCLATSPYLNPIGNCSSECGIGLISNSDKVCKRCHPMCEKCTNVTRQGCSMCSSIVNLFEKNGKCLDNCGEHYYKNIDDRKCKECHKTCEQCNGDLETNCTNCSEYLGYFTFLHENQCLRMCPTNYYRNIFTKNCTKPSGVIFIKPTVAVTILLVIATVIILIINVVKVKEQFSPISIMYALLSAVKFIDGIFLTAVLSFMHFDILNMVLIALSNLVQIVTATNFYMSIMMHVNGRKYFDPEIHKYFASYDHIVERLGSFCMAGMGCNGWRLIFSNMFAKPYFNMKVSHDIVFRKPLLCHSFAEGIASMVSIAGCLYALVRQDNNSYYFAHAITFLLLNLVLLIFLLLDFLNVKRLMRRSKLGVSLNSNPKPLIVAEQPAEGDKILEDKKGE